MLASGYRSLYTMLYVVLALLAELLWTLGRLSDGLILYLFLVVLLLMK